MTVSQSVISRSHPALTTPPALNPAPPLPYNHKYEVLAPGGYSIVASEVSLSQRTDGCEVRLCDPCVPCVAVRIECRRAMSRVSRVCRPGAPPVSFTCVPCPTALPRCLFCFYGTYTVYRTGSGQTLTLQMITVHADARISHMQLKPNLSSHCITNRGLRFLAHAAVVPEEAHGQRACDALVPVTLLCGAPRRSACHQLGQCFRRTCP